MGVFNKINQHSGIVFVVIISGLILFMLGADLFSKQSMFQSTDVGEVDGKSITREEFVKQMEVATQLYGGQASGNNLEDLAWNQVVFNNFYVEEYAKAGVTVSAEEEQDLLQGDNMHEVIKQFFGSPEGVKQFLASFEDENINIEDKKRRVSIWKSLKEYVVSDRLRKKYEALITKTEYATVVDAKEEYKTINDKVELKYVFVPYSSIVDSTIEVSDSDLKTYLKDHKNEFQVEEGRSIEFAIFNITPSTNDSLRIYEEVNALKEEFKNSTNDSAFVSLNSETQKALYDAKVQELPESIQNEFNNLAVGNVYGPYPATSGYQLTKIVKVMTDSLYSAKASHILFQTRQDDPEEKKKEQKDKALQILKEIQDGASFEAMAAQYGSDGTASRGGSLGWFGKGVMVKPFEDAIFGASKSGVLPKLVETQFGYHIVRIDVPKTNKKFKVASVDRKIETFDATKDSIYRVADELSANIKDTATLRAGVKGLKNVVRYEQPNVEKSARTITGVNEAYEVVKWLYADDRDINDVSKVFTVQDKYVVVLATAMREKGTAPLEDVRDQIKPRVLAELKAAKIKEKLKTDGALEAIAKSYGSEAQSGSVSDVTLSSGSLSTLGYEPEAVGYAFGLAKGQRTAAITGENGVYILELVNKTTSEVSDYNQTQSQIQNNRTQRLSYGVVDNVFRKLADIEDFRYRF
ncbi:MAG: peptidylprolyl isomerase [Cytophagaceae bacterium]